MKDLTLKNTKPQIFDAYSELSKENEQLQSQIERLSKEKELLEKQSEKITEKQKQVEKIMPEKKEKTELITSEATSVNQLINNLSKVGIDSTNAFNNLSSQLVAQASRLEGIRTQVQQKVDQLKTMYDLEYSDNTLDELIAEHNEKSQKFAEEILKSEETAKLEIEEMTSLWQKKKNTYEQTVRERNESSKIENEREEVEYKYNLELKRKLDEDNYKHEQKKLHDELVQLEQETKNKWYEKENEILEKENEFKKYQQEIDNYPQKLESEIVKAEQQEKEKLVKEATIQTDLLNKQFEGEKRIYEFKIKSLNETIKKQDQQILELSTRLDATVKLAQNIALKTIEGASSAGSLEAVKEIALEQAKNVSKSK